MGDENQWKCSMNYWHKIMSNFRCPIDASNVGSLNDMPGRIINLMWNMRNARYDIRTFSCFYSHVLFKIDRQSVWNITLEQVIMTNACTLIANSTLCNSCLVDETQVILWYFYIIKPHFCHLLITWSIAWMENLLREWLT